MSDDRNAEVNEVKAKVNEVKAKVNEVKLELAKIQTEFQEIKSDIKDIKSSIQLLCSNMKMWSLSSISCFRYLIQNKSLLEIDICCFRLLELKILQKEGSISAFNKNRTK